MPEPTNKVISIAGITLETKEIKSVGRINIDVLDKKMTLSLIIDLYSGNFIELKYKDIMFTNVNDIVNKFKKLTLAREQIILTRWPQDEIKIVDLN